MDETLLNEEITLSRAELIKACKDAYNNGIKDGKWLRDEELRKMREDQFNYDTKTYDMKDCPKDFSKRIRY